jgi:hypothetical protein
LAALVIAVQQFNREQPAFLDRSAKGCVVRVGGVSDALPETHVAGRDVEVTRLRPE